MSHAIFIGICYGLAFAFLAFNLASSVLAWRRTLQQVKHRLRSE